MKRSSIGIDTGGTFTDLAVYDASSGDIRTIKVPSTVRDPSQAFVESLEKLGKGAWEDARIVHGTTVATNILLERKGSRLAMLVTEGFRDLLEIGRTRRSSPGLFNTKFIKPSPLVPRTSRFEVPERIRADGTIHRPLDLAHVEAVCEELAKAPPEAVVVCFLHSYKHPEHEQEAARVLSARLPEVPIVLSSDVVPEYREYERLTTSVINAYVLPRVKAYLARLAQRIGGGPGHLYVMGSNGGILTAEAAGATPAKTILSGPAGGVNGAILACSAAGVENFITCDMGGTSTDVALIAASRATMVQESMFAGLPLKLPQLDINTVGAGGGSIAWRDFDGSLRVGPQSAGADPGPAAYLRGGQDVTVTDANLFLGRIAAGTLLSGEMTLDRQASANAIQRLAAALGYRDYERLAEGVMKLAVARMASAIREISIERGHDPRGFALVPLGGAGPMHAAELAVELGIRSVLVPRFPGNLSAVGLIGSDIRHDFARTMLVDVRAADMGAIRGACAELIAAGRTVLQREGFKKGDVRVECSAELRYRGQAFEVNVPFEVDEVSATQLCADFETRYEQRYGHRRAGKPIDLVTLRVVATGLVERPRLAEFPRQIGAVTSSEKGRRPVYFDGVWHRECVVYDRARLGAGVEFVGPAIVEEYGSTTAVPPGWRCGVDQLGNLRMERN